MSRTDAMKVLFVHEYSDNVAGQEVSLMDRLEGLTSRGISCEVLLPGGGEFADRLTQQGVPVRTAPLHRIESRRRPLPFLGTVAAVTWHLAAGRFDLVHCSGVYPHQYALPAARLLGKPTVVHINTSAYTRYCYNSNRLRQASMAITVSEKVRATVLEHADVRPWRVVTLYDGIQQQRLDEPFDRGALRADLGIPDGHKVVGQLASLIPRKGFDTFVEAAGLVAASHPDVTFLIMGRGEDPDYEEGLHRRVEELGLAERTRFVGFKPSYARYIDLLDVSVLASRAEGLPRILVESQMLGKPVIGTAIDGIVEAITPGENGLLVPPDDPSALAWAMGNLVSDEALAQRLGTNARHSARHRFTIPRAAEELEGLYVRVLAGKIKQP